MATDGSGFDGHHLSSFSAHRVNLSIRFAFLDPEARQGFPRPSSHPRPTVNLSIRLTNLTHQLPTVCSIITGRFVSKCAPLPFPPLNVASTASRERERERLMERFIVESHSIRTLPCKFSSDGFFFLFFFFFLMNVGKSLHAP